MLISRVSVKSRRDEHRESTRQAILDVAAAEFDRSGFAATSVDHVAAVARVSKGAVYYHFATKNALFEAVFRDRQAALLGKVGAAIQDEHEPWPRLERALDAYLDGTIEDRSQRSLILQAPAALGAERCHEIDEEIALPALTAALAAIEAAGELVSVPLEPLSRILFAALCEAAMNAVTAEAPTRARDEARAALAAMAGGPRA